MKALGVRFSCRADWKAQVEHVKKSFRSRLWTLRNLKKSGFSTEELLTVYKTMLHPIVEYACVVFHSRLTDDQDQQLELLQNQALKCIYGPYISARKMRAMAALPTLRERRVSLCDKFANKSLANPRFAHWFPEKRSRTSIRNGKNSESFREDKTRCDRLFYSPLFYYRRR